VVYWCLSKGEELAKYTLGVEIRINIVMMSTKMIGSFD
jgi:hypothetical protein